MSDQPAASRRPRALTEQWSVICPGDLGLKAGYLEGSEVTFRDIVGWITINAADLLDSTFQERMLLPLVINDLHALGPANRVDGFIGTFRKDLTADEALKVREQWRGPQQAEPLGINVPGLGKA